MFIFPQIVCQCLPNSRTKRK
ncbi:hypothetical protein SCA6_006457 [Theobroma cacao]